MIMGAAIWAKCNGTIADVTMPSDLYLGTTAAGAYNPTAHMTITAAGNVGIGTAAPTAPLTIDGDATTGASDTYMQLEAILSPHQLPGNINFPVI
jgi:hypothetical protein